MAETTEPGSRREYYRRRTAEMRKRLQALKLELGCIDCGYNTAPEALDFDHLPGYEKSAQVSHLLNCSWDRIMEEAAKCEVVCANCHRVRTHARRRAQAEADS